MTSGGYGYTVAQSIAYAYVPAKTEVDTPIEIDIFGRWIPGRVARKPLYDPAGARVRS